MLAPYSNYDKTICWLSLFALKYIRRDPVPIFIPSKYSIRFSCFIVQKSSVVSDGAELNVHMPLHLADYFASVRLIEFNSHPKPPK